MWENELEGRLDGGPSDTAERPRMHNQNPKDAYSKREFAERLGIGYVTAHRLTQDGTIRTVRAGRRVLIPRTEVDRFLQGSQK